MTRRGRSLPFVIFIVIGCTNGSSGPALTTVSASTTAAIAIGTPTIATTSLNVGGTLQATVTLTNAGPGTARVQQAVLRSFPPGQIGSLDLAPAASATMIGPGGSLTFSASRMIANGDPGGTWTAAASWLDATGVWHVGSTAAFTVGVPARFVTVDRASARFLLAGKPYYFAATNAYYLAQEHAYGNSVTTETLDAAKSLGFRVIRTIGYDDGSLATNPNDPAIIQVSPGVYRPSGLAAFDFVVDEAAKRDMRLIVTLVNNWSDFGGMAQYVKWAGLTDHDAFFTNPTVKQLYKSYLHDFVTRPSSITGIALKDDPAILSWELANEARCASDPGATRGVIAAWYQEMAAYLKTQDPNHLVGTGEEGNDTQTAGYSSYTTTSWLDGTAGTSFRANVALPGIDWGSVHVYPDAAGMKDAAGDGTKWITDHIAIARTQGKPLVVGEYGLSTSPHSIYKTWLDAVASSGGAGASLWELVTASRAAKVKGATDVVFPADPEVGALSGFGAVMNAK